MNFKHNQDQSVQIKKKLMKQFKEKHKPNLLLKHKQLLVKTENHLQNFTLIDWQTVPLHLNLQLNSDKYMNALYSPKWIMWPIIIWTGTTEAVNSPKPNHRD